MFVRGALMPAGFRPPGAPQRTRQPRVRSRLRSEESARTGVPAAVRRVNERSDMIAPVMVMGRMYNRARKTWQALVYLLAGLMKRVSAIIRPPATSPQNAPET